MVPENINGGDGGEQESYNDGVNGPSEKDAARKDAGGAVKHERAVSGYEGFANAGQGDKALPVPSGMKPITTQRSEVRDTDKAEFPVKETESGVTVARHERAVSDNEGFANGGQGDAALPAISETTPVNIKTRFPERETGRMPDESDVTIARQENPVSGYEGPTYSGQRNMVLPVPSGRVVPVTVRNGVTRYDVTDRAIQRGGERLPESGGIVMGPGTMPGSGGQIYNGKTASGTVTPVRRQGGTRGKAEPIQGAAASIYSGTGQRDTVSGFVREEAPKPVEHTGGTAVPVPARYRGASRTPGNAGLQTAAIQESRAEAVESPGIGEPQGWASGNAVTGSLSG
jgi:hypothetical protein